MYDPVTPALLVMLIGNNIYMQYRLGKLEQSIRYLERRILNCNTTNNTNTTKTNKN